MKTFTIDTDNIITVHASRNAARRAGHGVFATEEQFAHLIGPDNKRLLAIWNSLPGNKAVTKFASRKVATERIWKAIQNLAAVQTASQPELACAPEDSVPMRHSSEEREATATTKLAAPAEHPTAAQPARDVSPTEGDPTTKATRAKRARSATEPKVPRQGKTAIVLALLKRSGGATLPMLMEATGWQARSVRGFLSGTLGKRMGLKVISAKEGDVRTYSLQR